MNMPLGTLVMLLGLAAASCARNSPTTPAPEAPRPMVETLGTLEAVGFARIDWQVRNGSELEFVVERRHAPQPWKLRATLSPDPSGRMTLEDPTVSAGERYEYRVQVPGGDPEYQGAVTVSVPSYGAKTTARIATAVAAPSRTK